MFGSAGGRVGLVGGWVLQLGWFDPKIYVPAPGILTLVHQVRLIMSLLKMLEYSRAFLLLST